MARRAYGTGTLRVVGRSWIGSWYGPDGRRVQRKVGDVRTEGRADGLTKTQAERVLLSAREHEAAVGEAVVEQWQISRDLYVVLSGSVAVSVDGNARGTLGPGEFFGELARWAETEEFRWQLGAVSKLRPWSTKLRIGSLAASWATPPTLSVPWQGLAWSPASKVQRP